MSPLRGPAPKMLYLTFSTMDRHKNKGLVTERAEEENPQRSGKARVNDETIDVKREE